jgi:lipid II:glycine glycyltransferase (peptidoglycan interpeptide bridge formation enzyme)
MSPVAREEPSAWGARLRAAAATGELSDLPFVQQPSWAASKALTGWESVRLVAHDGAAWAGAQLLLQRLPAGLGRIAYAPRGPIVVAPNEAVAATLRTELLRGLSELRRDGVTLVRLEPGESTPLPDDADQVNPADALSADLRAPWLAAATTARIALHRARPVQPSTSRRIDLTAGMETVRAAWRSKWRQYARHATESGVTVRAVGADGADALYTAMTSISGRTGVKTRSSAAFAHIVNAFSGEAEILIAESPSGETLGALLVITTPTTTTELFGGATNSGNELRAPYALKVTAMERAVARGSATYDMWGISTSGIAHFKAGWGGAPVVYPGALDVDLDPIRGPLVRLALRLRGFGA